MTSSPPTSRRAFLTGSAALAAGMVLYSGEVARHEIETTQRTISLADLPSGFHGLRVVQLSDIHLDEYTEPFFLEDVVKRVNALAPDIVLLTGDFITRGSLTFVASNHAVGRCAGILQTLVCPERYAVLGNHDVTVGAALVTSALQSHGVPVLNNRFVKLVRGGDPLYLAGTADPGTDLPDLNLAIPPQPGGPVILMAHAPDYADVVAAHPRGSDVSFMLSGHSHGGQIRLPFVGPVVLPPMGRKYVEGPYQLGRMQLYVNRGIGTVGLPFRLNCPPEISLFTLQAAA
ncbi:MAG: metallophosphoesterase [Acidobacteriaceae bacterium]